MCTVRFYFANRNHAKFDTWFEFELICKWGNCSTKSRAPLSGCRVVPKIVDTILPIPSTRGPPNNATAGHCGAEEGDVIASQNHHLPCSKTSWGELPTLSRFYRNKPRGISSIVGQDWDLPRQRQWHHRVQSTPAAVLSIEEEPTVHPVICDPD
jgi:hypothetical protein